MCCARCCARISRTRSRSPTSSASSSNTSPSNRCGSRIGCASPLRSSPASRARSSRASCCSRSWRTRCAMASPPRPMKRRSRSALCARTSCWSCRCATMVPACAAARPRVSVSRIRVSASPPCTERTRASRSRTHPAAAPSRVYACRSARMSETPPAPALRVIISDDEPLARRGLQQLLAPHPECLVVAECRNGRETLRALRTLRPDIVFLDIQMPALNGFELLEAIGGERPPVVIFVTAYDEFAIRAFDAEALDYLLKPVSQERFDTALDRARERLRANHALRRADQLMAFFGREGGLLDLQQENRSIVVSERA